MSVARKKRPYKYRSHMSVGSAAAEEDQEYLARCFVETGDYEALQNFSSPRSILLGRTGVGKSALIMHLKQTQEAVIDIDPQTLALNYVSNSEVLRFFNALGVKLDIFYRLLWQHVFCVELLNYHFKIKSENEFGRFKDWILAISGKNKLRQVATEYLQKWNSAFWVEREERIKEITEKLETDIVAQAGLEAAGIKANAAYADKISHEVKSDIVHRAQKVVNDIQIQHLSQVIDLLADELFLDKQKRVFITIDGLDEDWVEDDLRYKLIRALVEVTKKFRRIQNVKIVIALRTDLLERVYKNTRDAGFQEEKYEDLNIRLSWKPAQIKQLLDYRLNKLFEGQYTTERLDFYDVFPETVKSNQATLDFLIARTLMRPRDAIAFVNTVLERAEGVNDISKKMILDAERVYSERRFHALLHEWYADYPKLEICASILKNMPTSFYFESVSNKDIDDLLIRLHSGIETNDAIEQIAREAFNSPSINYDAIKASIFSVFYKVGFIGSKMEPSYPYSYSYESGHSSPTFREGTKIQIHPMLWSYFSAGKIKGGILSGED